MNDRFRELDREDFDVVVVGAGTGGLTAAALLAKRGKRVLVLDRHYVAGGNGTVFKRMQPEREPSDDLEPARVRGSLDTRWLSRPAPR